MDDTVTLLDIIMVSFLSLLLCYFEKRQRLAKERESTPSGVSRTCQGRKFYWIRLDKGKVPQIKIWIKQDSV